jgi:hypothetical protein
MKSGQNVVGEAPAGAVNEAQDGVDVSERRPYGAPTVRTLGSVRDLTLGSKSPLLDSFGGRHT